MNELSRLHLGMAVLDIASTPIGRVVAVDRSRFELQLFTGESCWLSEAALFVVRASGCAELICARGGISTYLSGENA